MHMDDSGEDSSDLIFIFPPKLQYFPEVHISLQDHLVAFLTATSFCPLYWLSRLVVKELRVHIELSFPQLSISLECHQHQVWLKPKVFPRAYGSRSRVMCLWPHLLLSLVLDPHRNASRMQFKYAIEFQPQGFYTCCSFCLQGFSPKCSLLSLWIPWKEFLDHPA